MPVDDGQFQTLLDQIRELHELADELTHSRSRFDANVRARLHWYPQPPALPSDQRKIADEIIELLSERRLSSSQSRQLHQAFFSQRRRPPRTRPRVEIWPVVLWD